MTVLDEMLARRRSTQHRLDRVRHRADQVAIELAAISGELDAIDAALDRQMAAERGATS